MSRFIVNLYDCAGCYRSVPVDSFAAVLNAAETYAANYPDKVVLCFDVDQSDLNFDGFSDEQRDEITDAIARGRRLAVGRTGT